MKPPFKLALVEVVTYPLVIERVVVPELVKAKPPPF